MQDRRLGNMREVPDMTGLHWERIDLGPDWMDQFKNFKKSAFRLEVLQAYKEPAEAGAIADFAAGQPVPREYFAGWCDLVASHIQAGHEMKRVHLVDLPLSLYMRFEVEAAYIHTAAAGEQIQLLDRSKVDSGLLPFLKQDFWFFDNERVMVQIYNEAGTLQFSLVTSDLETVTYYREVAQRVLRLGEPFREFYVGATGKRI